MLSGSDSGILTPASIASTMLPPFFNRFQAAALAAIPWFQVEIMVAFPAGLNFGLPDEKAAKGAALIIDVINADFLRNDLRLAIVARIINLWNDFEQFWLNL
jgi:hypothetical protein